MTTRIETLRALQARIRQSKGADRELDAEIAALFLGGEIECRQANYTMDLHPVRKYASTMHVGGIGREPVVYYTASLDACVALMDAVLPGWKWSVADNRYEPVRGKAFASVQTPTSYDGPAPWPEGWGHNDNPCLAFLDAIFSAAIAELEARGEAA